MATVRINKETCLNETADAPGFLQEEWKEQGL